MLDPLLRFAQKHSLLVIGATLLVTLVMGVLAMGVEIDPDLASLIPKDDKYVKLTETYGGGRVRTEYLAVAIEAENPFTLEGLQAFGSAIEEIRGLPGVDSVMGPFGSVTFVRGERGLRVVPLSPGGEAPRTTEDLALFRRRSLDDPFARRLVVSDDGRMLAALFPTGSIGDHAAFMAEVERAVEPLKRHYATHLIGPVVFEDTARRHLVRDLPILLGLSIALIMAVYYVGFQAKRAVVLPLLAVLMGTIWTVGLMRLLGYTFSVITIIIPPFILTLGSSYSIHILNQYFRDAAADEAEGGYWISGAVGSANRTVLLAAGTTVLGLLSLLVTSIRQTREFGITASAGIAACAVISVFFFPAALSRIRKPSPQQRRRVLEGPLARLTVRLAGFSRRWRVPILLVSVLLIGAAGVSVRYVRHHADYLSYFPRSDKVVQDTQAVYDRLGGYQQVYVTVNAPDGREGYFLDPRSLEPLIRFEEALGADPTVFQVISFVSYVEHLNSMMYGQSGVPANRALVRLLARTFTVMAAQAEAGSVVGLLAAPDFSRLTVAMRIYDPDRKSFVHDRALRAVIGRLEDAARLHLDPDTKPAIWGTSLSFLTLSDVIDRDQLKCLLISVLLIFALTAAGFRSALYGLLSLVPLVTGITLNFTFMVLTGIPLDITTVMVSSVALGVGVDNSIHLLIQYRRQRLVFPDDEEKTMEETLRISGRPILLTTASIVGGLSILTLASLLPVRYFGLLVALTLLTTSAGSLLVLPALLTYLRGLAKDSQTEEDEESKVPVSG